MIASRQFTTRLIVEAVIALWLIAFSLSCRLAGHVEGPPLVQGSVLLYRLVSLAREGLGRHFFLVADRYFHRGLEPHHGHALEGHPLRRLADVVRPSGHSHTEGYSASEIVPWLRMAVLANPEDLDAVLTLAYWLVRLDRWDAADEVLREVQRLHPHSAEVLAERAYLAFRRRRLPLAAALADAALREGETTQSPLERTRLLTLRGFLYELEGRPDAARAVFEEAVRLSPEHTRLREHLQDLAAGRAEKLFTWERFEQLFPERHVCTREHHEH